MPPADLLRARRERMTAQVAALERAFAALVAATEGANTDDEHDPEGATIAFERSQLTASLDAARTELAAVDRALSRLVAGTYGRCDVCGRAIADARLEARPTATTCVGCAGHLRSASRGA